MAIFFCFAACKNSSSSEDGTDPFAGTEWSGSGASLKFYSDGTVGDSSASTSGLRYKVSSSGGSYTATIYAEAYGQTVNFATLTISNENASSGTYKLDGSGVSATLKKVGGASSNENGNSSGDNNVGSSNSEADPFAGTEWSSGGTSLKFYSDGTVGGSAASTNGLRYRVDSSGGSYTATIYTEVSGYTINFATLMISSKNASSGTYRLDGSGISTTLKKVEGTSSNEGGSASIDKEDSNSNNNSESDSKGTKGGSSGDQFINTVWYGDGLSLNFGNYGNVTYEADGLYFYYDYYFKSTGGSYTATIYDNNTLMLTFEFSIANPTFGNLTFGSSNYNYTTLKRNSSGSEPTDDTWYDQNEDSYQDDNYWQY